MIVAAVCKVLSTKWYYTRSVEEKNKAKAI